MTPDDPGEAIAAMADQADALWASAASAAASIRKMPDSATYVKVLSCLEQLSDEWTSNGMGHDGAFVNVSGDRRQGDPMFPHRLAKILVLHVRKNAAYVGDDPDPLSNYVNAGKAIGVFGWQAAYMRMAEKVSRLRAIFNREGRGSHPEDDETVEETLLDIAVIALLTCSLYRANR